MRYNPDQCLALRLSIRRSPQKSSTPLKAVLYTPDSSTHLGVDINVKLTWDQHINRISVKANRTLEFVKRNIQTAFRATKELAYKALVIPKWNREQ